MTPQERQLVDDLFDRLSKTESAPRDPQAVTAISEGLRKAPSAVYALVQTVLVQDEALRRANDRIQELEAAGAPAQEQGGGFLDSMRGAMFGQSQSRGSVPNVRPPEVGSRPVWNSGQAMQQAGYPGRYDQPPYGQPYGGPQPGMGGDSPDFSDRGRGGDKPDFADLVSGKCAGRTSRDQVTFYRNVGNQGLQFSAVGGWVYEQAMRRKIGREIPTEWFLQDIRD